MIVFLEIELLVGRPAGRILAQPEFQPPAGFPYFLLELSGRILHAESVRTRPTETSGASDVGIDDWPDIRASVGGNGEAFERIVRRYQDPIGAYLWRFTRDHLQWEELLQDVFVEAYLSLSRYSGRAPLLHWLKRIATRVGYRYWKSQRRRQDEVSLSSVIEASIMMSTSESAQHAAELVHQLLAHLGPRDRLIMTLSYLEGCSVKEIARLTGWTETMVKVQAHRARKRLAKICKQREIEL